MLHNTIYIYIYVFFFSIIDFQSQIYCTTSGLSSFSWGTKFTGHLHKMSFLKNGPAKKHFYGNSMYMFESNLLHYISFPVTFSHTWNTHCLIVIQLHYSGSTEIAFTYLSVT